MVIAAMAVMMVAMCGGMLLFGHKAHKGHKERAKAVSQEAAVPKSTGTAAGLPVETHEGHEDHGTR